MTLTLNLSSAVTVAGTPTLTLNDGGTATYTGGNGTNALTFKYSVGAVNSAVAALAITKVNLPAGATVTDAAGNAANLSGAVKTFSGLSIDPPPVLVSVSESPSTGDLNAGNTVTLTLGLNDVVTVAGGIPTLTLNDGGIATYIGGPGTNALMFSYTVAVGQNTVGLTASAVNLNGATITNGMGGSANLSLTGLTQTGPQINTTAHITQVGKDYFLYNVSGTGPELKIGGAAVTVGEFGSWTPMASVQVAGGGYDVVFNIASIGQYTAWSTDSNGNYVTQLFGAVSGNSAALESLETTFDQDLNGDGAIGLFAAPSTTMRISSTLSGTSGSATIGTRATLELAAADSASITFSNSTGMLKLDNPSTFSGTIFNFTGNGTLSGSDQIDLKGINFSSVHDTYSNGVLTVTDGTHTDALDFNGSYTLANFKFASDGYGGTIVYDPPAPAGKSGTAAVENLTNDPVVSTLNQQLALWSQHMASAFPSGFSNGGPSMVGPSEWNGQLSQLAQPVTHQQHA
jgi:Tryptophan-rich Synechocystis species C-terminal domain